MHPGISFHNFPSWKNNLSPVVGRIIAMAIASFMVLLSGCATKVPSSESAASAAAGSGTQTIQATGVRRVLGIFAPFRINIQQGNFVSSEMLAQLKVGMTPEQVRFTLGTPLLTDVFHADRWEYIFRLQRGNGEVTTSRVTVYFKDGTAASFEGGDLPTETQYLARIAGAAPPAKPLPPVTPPKAMPPSASETK